MTTVTLQEAQTNLSDVLQRLQPGEEVLITDQGQTVAKMQKAEQTSWPCKAGSLKEASADMTPRKAGSAKDKILWIAPDFDEPLEDFREYME